MEGASRYNFNPVMNYPGASNKYINKYASTTGKMVDQEGNYYYVSHPPFAYLFPYFIFELFQIQESVIAIEVFNLVINFVSALFIYLIICTLRRSRPFEKMNPEGLCGFLIYLFSAAVLWFQCNTYMSDMLVHFFFILCVYFILQIFFTKKVSPLNLILFGVNLFLMIYTSWLGIFFAFSLVLYGLTQLRKEKASGKIIILTIVISLAAIGLFVYQYSLINGFDAYIDQMKNRLELRSGLQPDRTFYVQLKDFLKSWGIILFNYLTSYFPFILLFIFWIYKLMPSKQLPQFIKKIILYLWLSVVPILLMHIFLSEYSGHDFTSLYASLFLSVTLALLFGKLRELQLMNPKKLWWSVGFCTIVSIGSYYYINRPGPYSLKGDSYNLSQNLGKEIKNTSTFDAVVFAIGNAVIDPQLMYYAKRNIKEVNNKEEAIQFLRSRNLSRGIIYYSSNPRKSTFDKIEKVNLEN